MKVLIGIPTHKRPELLRECLKSIASQQGSLPPIEVFVADNDPKGKAGAALVMEIAREFRFSLTSTVVAEPGLSAVRNAILDEARHRKADFIAMIDDDETARANWLVELLEAQADYGADIVGGPVDFDLQGDQAFEGAFWRDPRPSGATDVLYATNNVLACGTALNRLDWPMFDPRFGLTGGEDVEWFARIKRRGVKFAWNANAIVTEVVPQERRTIRWLLKRQFRVGATQIRIAKLHGAGWDLSVLLAKAAGSIALFPIQAFGLRYPRRRIDLLRQWARAAGRFGALMGFQHREYVSRHGDDAKDS